MLSLTSVRKMWHLTITTQPPAYGHPGISCTIDFMEQSYWWPGLHKDVANYIRGCGECQWHKVNNQPTKALIQPIYPGLPTEVCNIHRIFACCVQHNNHHIELWATELYMFSGRVWMQWDLAALCTSCSALWLGKVGGRDCRSVPD